MLSFCLRRDSSGRHGDALQEPEALVPANVKDEASQPNGFNIGTLLPSSSEQSKFLYALRKYLYVPVRKKVFQETLRVFKDVVEVLKAFESSLKHLNHL